MRRLQPGAALGPVALAPTLPSELAKGDRTVAMRDLQPSDTLVIRDTRVSRRETAIANFDITGYKFGRRNDTIGNQTTVE
jgi:hypothetical protein